MRASGMLLHITSLPSPHGIGTLGREAYKFIDFLSASGQKYWQILPMGPTGFGDSPYQTFSAFAGNPYLIDLDMLAQQGLLTKIEIEEIDWGDDETMVDFGKVYLGRRKILPLACKRLWERDTQDVISFAQENATWLEPYADFKALREKYGQKPWYEWPQDYRDGLDEIEAETTYHKCVQYLFFSQWTELRKYARKKGIEFIGDVPIYVPLDSADVWSAPQNYLLDENMRPTQVAGVPPDGFTADGQLWGNPIYDWDAMAKDGFGWWIKRLEAAAKLFDVVRIDHFRGLASYWAVPAGETTAKNGVWRPGPGKAFVDAIKTGCPDISFIAEDLGYLTPDVKELVEYSGFPGMKVLEFAFDPREPSDYLPHSYGENCVCYAGTHDNETLKQWLEGISGESREYAKKYLGLNDEEGYINGMLRGGMSSVAALFVTQMQDLLEKGGEARMNAPGTFGGRNWRWRMEPDAATPALAEKLQRTTQLYGRMPHGQEEK